MSHTESSESPRDSQTGWVMPGLDAVHAPMATPDPSGEWQYDLERASQFLQQRSRELGVSRRRLLQLLAASSTAATAGLLPRRAASQGRPPSAGPSSATIQKPTPGELFVRNGSNAEMRWESLYGRGFLVPNSLFFVRNNGPTPLIDVARWRLRVEGNGVERPLSLSYDELLAMPSVSVMRAIECAGNGRNFFEQSHGRRIEGTPWNLGGVGVAEWTGVPLAEVLQRAGVKATARDVMPIGLDAKAVQRPLPLSKAMAEDTLLVYAMNGDPLPPDHGFPLRVLVPGWVGIAHIKWVGSVQVSETPLFSEYNTRRYVLIGEDYPVDDALAAQGVRGQILTTQGVKSAFELPWNGTIEPGKRLVRGRSWSGEGAISRVQVSFDGGRQWKTARLRAPNIAQAWVRWDLDWDPQPGRYGLLARATDDRGRSQPERIPLNAEGYSYGAVVSHPIRVR